MAQCSESFLSRVNIGTYQKAITTLVTTRQLGFCAARIYNVCAQYKHPCYCNIYAFYRVNLLLFEKRMVMAKRTFTKLTSRECYEFMYNSDFLRAAYSVSGYPAMVGMFLSVLGPVSDSSGYYVPALCQNRYVEGRFCPMSEQVTFSNLRQVVEALADASFSIQARRAFYAHNPIPGAQWGGDPLNPVLLNPDEIMPVNYTINQLHNDILDYNTMLHWMQRKLGKYVFRGRIDFQQKGSKSLLVSNKQEDLRCSDRGPDETLEDYYSRISLEGDINEFWSCRRLDKQDALMGVANLTGEVPVLDCFMYPDYSLRSDWQAVCFYSVAHRGIILNLFN